MIVLNFCKLCHKEIQSKKTYCSYKCSNSDPELKIKRNQQRMKSNLKKYGTETTLGLKQVMDARQNVHIINQASINKKRKKWWTKENIKKVNNQREKTVWGKYGVSFVNQLEETKEKRKQTCIMKYGVSSPLLVLENRKKMIKKGIETKIRKLYVIAKKDCPSFKSYRKLVERFTRINKKPLYENWDGNCFYSKIRLKKKEESIDHKTSVLFGFINKIAPEIIGGLPNLCICSRLINSRKSYKNYDEFIQIFK